MPPYEQHGGASQENGFGDFSMLAKYRFLSANEEHGNYILTGFMGVSVPTGAPPNGGQAVTLPPGSAVDLVGMGRPVPPPAPPGVAQVVLPPGGVLTPEAAAALGR